MPTIKSARVSKLAGKSSRSTLNPQWRKALLDPNAVSRYRIVKPAPQLTELSNTTSTQFTRPPGQCQGTWFESIRIARQDVLRDLNLKKRARLIFSQSKTPGVPDPTIPNLGLQNLAELHLYEQYLTQVDQYLQKYDRFNKLRHVRSTDRCKIRSLFRAQASHIDPPRLSLGEVIGPNAIKNWLRDIGRCTTGLIPEIATPVVKSFSKAFQQTLQSFRLKQKEHKEQKERKEPPSNGIISNPITIVNRLTCKRSRPSEFDFVLEHRPCKRPCVDQQERNFVPRGHPPPLQPITPPGGPSSNITETPSSPSSTSTSYIEEQDDDTLSQCSTDTSCTALSYDEESPPTSANPDHSKKATDYYPYQESSLFKTISRARFLALQERAEDPEFSPTSYDRSFSLSVCGLEADENIEYKEPSPIYPALDDAEAQGVLKDLKAFRLDSESERDAFSRPINMPANVVTLPPQVISNTSARIDGGKQAPIISKSPPAHNKSIKSAANDTNHVQISNPYSTISQPPPIDAQVIETPRYSSQSPGLPPKPASVQGKRKLHQTITHPLDIILSNLDLVPTEHHQLVEQMISQCKGSNLENDTCIRSLDQYEPTMYESLLQALTKGQEHGFTFRGNIFHFNDLLVHTSRKLYTNLWKLATKRPLEFRDILATMFMEGLHPKDCFPRGSAWIEKVFDEREPRLNNKLLDDRHAWYDLRCIMSKPAIPDLPSEDDEEFVKGFMNASLDILQKVMEDWLDVDSDELLAERVKLFRAAMEESYLCEPGSNKELQDLIQWFYGRQMDDTDTYNNPRQAYRQQKFDDALEKLLWYRYPRSCKWEASAELSLESYNEREEHDNDWLVDNKIPGRVPK